MMAIFVLIFIPVLDCDSLIAVWMCRPSCFGFCILNVVTPQLPILLFSGQCDFFSHRNNVVDLY